MTARYMDEPDEPAESPAVTEIVVLQNLRAELEECAGDVAAQVAHLEERRRQRRLFGDVWQVLEDVATRVAGGETPLEAAIAELVARTSS